MTASTPVGKTQSRQFSRGAFTVFQDRSDTTDLRLVGGRPAKKLCGSHAGATGGAVGTSTAVACAPDGTVACWGSNSNGQAAAPPGTFIDVSAGFAHTCAIRSDDARQCWGDNSNGQATPG